MATPLPAPDRASELNAALAALAPGAEACLSALGRRAALPLGIPQQSAEAAGCERQATIGQITTGSGRPLTLPAMRRHFVDLDERQAFLYAPTTGLLALRQAWAARIGAEGMSLPLVTAGMSHGLSLVADLFGGPGHPLVLGAPFWDNYATIFQLRCDTELRPFNLFVGEQFNVPGMAAALATLDGPGTLLLNFPNNPTGYSPTVDVAEQIVRVVAAHPHPLVVVTDDAYGGLYFDDDCLPGSMFNALAAAVDPARTLVCKIDGATKELVFFGGRVGFLTFSAGGRAGEILVEKAATVLRGTLSSVSAPTQAAVLSALRDPQLAGQEAEVVGVLARRYRVLKASLASAGLEHFPFNSGCFALLRLPAGHDANVVRRRLIADESTGVIAVPAANALRVAFCSIDETDIPDLVARIARVLRSL